MEKKLEEMSALEIKAMLYEQIVIMERTKNNINILQNRLQELENPKQEGK